MKRLKGLAALTLLLLTTQTLAACETIDGILGGGEPPAEIRASTFCKIYKPVRAPGERGSSIWKAFWDNLQLNYPDQYDVIRKNNAAWQANCFLLDAPPQSEYVETNVAHLLL